ncbi:MAG: tetratricopeptide repeat protein [Planctomycetes bacterium]|nr:tetratricopeptide repeat protein [Planctomycetota bacterium]
MTRRTARRAARRIAGAAALAAVLGLGVWAWRALGPSASGLRSDPPDLELAGADPAAAEAIRAATAGVRRSPRSAEAWGDLGMTLLAHEVFAPAAACLEQAALRAPAEARWPYLQGLALQKGEAEPRAAVRAFERAAEAAARGDPVPRLKLAETLLEQGDAEAAERHFRRALEQDPANARARAGLGRAAYLRGDLEAALRELGASAGAAPRAKATRVLLAEVHHRLGRAGDAERERRAAAGLPDAHRWPDPHSDRVLARWTGVLAGIERANDLLAGGRADDALRLLRDTVERYPRALLALLSLGRTLLQTGDAAGAEEALRRAADLEPAAFEAHHELAAALLRQGKTPAAAASFRRALEVKPDYAPSHHGLGQSLLRQGDREGAAEAFRAAVRYRPNYAAAHRDLGQILVALGRTAEGIERLRDALRLNPQDTEAARLLEAAGARP